MPGTHRQGQTLPSAGGQCSCSSVWTIADIDDADKLRLMPASTGSPTPFLKRPCRFSDLVSPCGALTCTDASCLTRCHLRAVSDSCHFCKRYQQTLFGQQVGHAGAGLPSGTIGQVAAVGVSIDRQDPVAPDPAQRRTESHRDRRPAHAALDAENPDLVGRAALFGKFGGADRSHRVRRATNPR
jgi:hypothetical protein